MAGGAHFVTRGAYCRGQADMRRATAGSAAERGVTLDGHYYYAAVV